LKTTAIQDGSYQPEHNKRLPEALDAKERLEVKVGDLLMTCAGPRVRCGVACLVRETPPKRFISGKMYRFRANEALIDSRLLEAFLRTPSTKAQIDAMKTGISESGMNITHEKFSQLIVPIAPLSEQKRIADKLDTVLTRVDAVNTRLARVAPLLKRFRQSVLAAATSGRLTEDWRGKSDFVAPVKPLSEIGKVTGGLTKNSKREALPLQKPYLRVANVHANELRLDEVLSLGLTPQEFEKTRLEVNDLLIVEGNGSLDQIGRVAIWRGEVEGCCHQNHLIRWRASGDVLPTFALYYLLSPAGRAQIVATSSSTTGLHTLSVSKVGAVTLPVPSFEEQTEIVRRVEALFAFADRLEARLAQAQTAATRLTPALLAKAFRGELVPQDPNDEPAAQLLRRLQAERATAPKASTGRGRKAAVQV
jgi:type I restriction enzyme S subunit